MKILLSAFAFAPNIGSEPGVGWRWALELAKNHQVTVVTDVTRRKLVEAEGVRLPDNVEVVFYRPAWLRKVPLNSSTAQLLYTLWQFGLIWFAKHMHQDRKFDLAIHVTYGVFRHPSFLGYLGIPFVFGPLGGGEDAPLALKRSIHGLEKLKEIIRTILNTIALFDPFLWAAYAKTSLILVKTEETRRALPWPFRGRAVLHPEIGVDVINAPLQSIRKEGEPLRVLFVGRLLGWKGAHLAIRAVAKAIDQGISVDFTLLGKGSFESELRRVAIAVGIHDRINWINHLPQKELFSLYGRMHCFLFPSLHDSSGNVVLESLSFGLPVICLDLGGPKTLVDDRCAFIVGTKDKSEAEVVDGLAQALLMIGQDEENRLRMSTKAKQRALEFSWDSRVLKAMMHIERYCFNVSNDNDKLK